MTGKKFQCIARPATVEERKRHAESREKVMQEFPPLLSAKPGKSPSGITVMSAEYIDGYTVRLRFSNGETGVVDLKDSVPAITT